MGQKGGSQIEFADAAADVLARERARLDAQLAGDVDTAGRLFHPELTYVHTSGEKDDRTSLLAKIADRRIRYHRFDITGQTVRLFGNVALVDGESEIAFERDGIDRVLTTRIVEVWLSGPEGWQLAHYQSTLLPPVEKIDES